MVIDIDKRTFNFSLRIIRLVSVMPKTPIGKIISSQLIRSGTSIGANVEEALGAHTKTDFAYKMNIAKSEARETKYWLRLIAESSLVKPALLTTILLEADELVAILSTIVKNSKK